MNTEAESSGIWLGTSSDGLWFGSPQVGSDGTVERIDLILRQPNLDVRWHRWSSYDVGFDDLVAFVDGLAADWRGWEGERSYEPTYERDLRITARHDGHVHLAVHLCQSAEPEGWSVSTHLTLDPGEQLTEAARGLHAMLHSTSARNG